MQPYWRVIGKLLFDATLRRTVSRSWAARQEGHSQISRQPRTRRRRAVTRRASPVNQAMPGLPWLIGTSEQPCFLIDPPAFVSVSVLEWVPVPEVVLVAVEIPVPVVVCVADDVEVCVELRVPLDVWVPVLERVVEPVASPVPVTVTLPVVVTNPVSVELG